MTGLPDLIDLIGFPAAAIAALLYFIYTTRNQTRREELMDKRQERWERNQSELLKKCETERAELQLQVNDQAGKIGKLEAELIVLKGKIG